MRMGQVVSINSRSPELQAVGSGFIALDVLLDKNSSVVSTAIGGSAGNVLAALAYLGWSSVPVAELGKDAASEQIKAEFDQLKTDLRFLVERENKCTPVVYQSPVKGDGETHSFSFTCPFCGVKPSKAELTNDKLAKNVLEHVPNPNVFYFDRVSTASLFLAKHYRLRGALIVFEPSSNTVSSEMFQQAVSTAHVLKYADNRFDKMLYDRSNVQLEIKTMGAAGLQFRAPSLLETWTHLPAIKIPFVKDTAGAGDWCTAGMLYSLLQAGKFAWPLTHERVRDALRFGQALAAINCMHFGARGMMHLLSAHDVKSLVATLLKHSDGYGNYEWSTTLRTLAQLNRPQEDEKKNIGSMSFLCC